MRNMFSSGCVGNLTFEETVIVVGCTVLMGFLVLASSSRACPGRAAETTPSYDLRRFEATAGRFSLDNNSLFYVSTPWTSEIHGGGGNILFANRGVMELTNASLRAAIQALGTTTNRLIFP